MMKLFIKVKIPVSNIENKAKVGNPRQLVEAARNEQHHEDKEAHGKMVEFHKSSTHNMSEYQSRQ